MLGWTSLVTIFLITGGPAVFRLFLPDPEAASLGAVYMRIIAVCEIFGTFEFVCGGTFNGLGRTIPSAVTVIACNSFRVVLAWFLSQTSLGVYGVWVGITTGAVLRGVVLGLWFLAAQRKLPHEDKI
jgi:Na+-driven multidrug efflux pump